MTSKQNKLELTKNQKITFFIDSLSGGGAERVVSVLCNNLAEKKRYDIDIMMLRKVPIEYELNEVLNLYYAEDIEVTSFFGRTVRKIFSIYRALRQGIFKPAMLKLGWYEKFPKIDETWFYYYSRYAVPYREYLKKHEVDTAVGFLIRSNIAMLMAAKGTGVKTLYCERNNPIRPDIPVGLVKMRNKLTHQCSATVFQTNEQRDYYTWIKGATAVIPNPIKEGLPERYSGKRRHEIVNFCRLSKQKNLPLLIDAFEQFQNVYPDYTLRIYGKGDEKRNLVDYIVFKNLQKSVFVEDFSPNIHELIRDAAMFVSTSDFEGISNSMIEAMAIGLPCVCTDCAGGGARMMIQDHVNGILVPVGDVQAVYKGMKEIIENKELAENLSKEASKIREKLSISKIADQWEAMINK